LSWHHLTTKPRNSELPLPFCDIAFDQKMEQPTVGQKRKLEEEEKVHEEQQEKGKDEEPQEKKPRTETEIVTAKVKKQIEFYFSDSNFRRDKWLQEESAKHPEGCALISQCQVNPVAHCYHYHHLSR